MSRRTRPKQRLDANNNVLPYSATQGPLRASYEGGANLRYHGSSRPNEVQRTDEQFEGNDEWRIYRVTYLGNNVISTQFVNGSDDWIHVWDAGANGTITGVTQANPGVITISASTWSDGTAIADGQKIEITGIGGMVELNNNYYFVDDFNLGALTFTLNVGNNVNVEVDTGVDTSGFTVFSSNGTGNFRSYLNHTYN